MHPTVGYIIGCLKLMCRLLVHFLRAKLSLVPSAVVQERLQSMVHTVLVDCGLTTDSIPLCCEPNASWLFMADAPLSRPLSSAHTWLLWDEVTTPILARTPQTPWKQCCVTSQSQSKLSDQGPKPGLQ